MHLLLLCEPLFTPRSGLEYDWGLYLEFTIIKDYRDPKNVIHVHSSDISKLNKINKSHNGCEIGKLSSGLFFLFPMQ